METADFSTKYGPWALVTGAAEGLGAEFARQIAAAGIATLFVDVQIEKAQAQAEAIARDCGVETRAIACDLADPNFLATLVEQTADLEIGLLMRLLEDASWMGDAATSVALALKARVPTGDNSSGVDGEARLILTNDYASGLRSHINVWGKTVNGHVEHGQRDFRWGLVLGADGPLCDDGSNPIRLTLPAP